MSAFQITPFGIVIIAAYSFAIGTVALLLSRLLKNFRWRWWLLAPPALLLMALPWAEEAWIAWHFNEACKDAGVKVYRQVEVDGYVNDSSRSSRKSATPGLWKLDSGSLNAFDSAGYRFTENMLDDDGALRVERHPEGLMVTVLDHPSGRYHLRYAYQPNYHSHEESVGWRLQKVERQVIDSQTGEILGRDVIIKRWASVGDALWAQFIGSTLRMCPAPDFQPQIPSLPFPQSVLKPISKP
jgi:hypothetical protein